METAKADDGASKIQVRDKSLRLLSSGCRMEKRADSRHSEEVKLAGLGDEQDVGGSTVRGTPCLRLTVRLVTCTTR